MCSNKFSIENAIKPLVNPILSLFLNHFETKSGTFGCLLFLEGGVSHPLMVQQSYASPDFLGGGWVLEAAWDDLKMGWFYPIFQNLCADHAEWLHQIRRYHYTWWSIWPRQKFSVNTGSKRDLIPPFNFLGLNELHATVDGMAPYNIYDLKNQKSTLGLFWLKLKF